MNRTIVGVVIGVVVTICAAAAAIFAWALNNIGFMAHRGQSMKRLTRPLPIWLSVLIILLTSAQWSFGQTGLPKLRIGAVQANQEAGLTIETESGTVAQLIGAGNIPSVTSYGDQIWWGGSAAQSVHLNLNAGAGFPFLGIGSSTPNGINVLRIVAPAGGGSAVYALSFEVPSYNTSANVGILGSAANGMNGTIGVYGIITGASGAGYLAGVRGQSASTVNAIKSGILGLATGANGTNNGGFFQASGGATNYDIQTAGSGSLIKGFLDLTDSAQRITVNTTNNTVIFGSNAAIVDCDDGTISTAAKLNLGAGSALTISGNAITVTKSRHSVTASGASDTLNTISGGVSGDLLYLCGTAGKTITVADNAGNIQCGANITLDSANDWVTLIYDGSNWQEAPGIDN